MSLDETTFEQVADKFLGHLMDTIEGLLGDQMDVDVQSGILTIELDAGGQYVINKHGPNRQVWMSSPKSGATHYDYDETTKAWVGTRSDDALIDVLSAELAAVTGKSVDLSQ